MKNEEFSHGIISAIELSINVQTESYLKSDCVEVVFLALFLDVSHLTRK
ncbi:hypothetical protein [Polynucleobacter bastaniensis]|nr:hypothetical protein [Polynucleobacter bastaniensis]